MRTSAPCPCNVGQLPHQHACTLLQLSVVDGTSSTPYSAKSRAQQQAHYMLLRMQALQQPQSAYVGDTMQAVPEPPTGVPAAKATRGVKRRAPQLHATDQHSSQAQYERQWQIASMQQHVVQAPLHVGGPLMLAAQHWPPTALHAQHQLQVGAVAQILPSQPCVACASPPQSSGGMSAGMSSLLQSAYPPPAVAASSDVAGLVDQFVSNRRLRQNTINAHLDEVQDALEQGDPVQFAFWSLDQDSSFYQSPGTAPRMLEVLAKEIGLTAEQMLQVNAHRGAIREDREGLKRCHALLQRARSEIEQHVRQSSVITEQLRDILDPVQVWWLHSRPPIMRLPPHEPSVPNTLSVPRTRPCAWRSGG